MVQSAEIWNKALEMGEGKMVTCSSNFVIRINSEDLI